MTKRCFYTDIDTQLHFYGSNLVTQCVVIILLRFILDSDRLAFKSIDSVESNDKLKIVTSLFYLLTNMFLYACRFLVLYFIILKSIKKETIPPEHY